LILQEDFPSSWIFQNNQKAVEFCILCLYLPTQYTLQFATVKVIVTFQSKRKWQIYTYTLYRPKTQTMQRNKNVYSQCKIFPTGKDSSIILW